jgi:ferredoxin
MPILTFSRSNVQIEIEEGAELLKVPEKSLSAPLRFGCRKGICGVCAIEIGAGEHHLTKQCPQEKRTLESKGYDQKFRLACQCAVNGDVTIHK